MPEAQLQDETPATLPDGLNPSTFKAATINGSAARDGEEHIQRVLKTARTGSTAATDEPHGAGDVDSATPRVVEADDSPLTVAAQAIQAAVETPALPSGGATAARQDTGNTSLAAILLAVDTLEALITALNAAVATAARQDTGNTSLASILSSVDGLETLATALNAAVATAAKQDAQTALLTTIDGRVDGLEALATTLNSLVTTLNGLVATAANQATANSSLASILSAVDGLEGSTDGLEAGIGAPTDAEQTGDGSLISVAKRLRTLLGTIIGHVDGIEALLGGTLSVSGSVTANAGTNLNTSLLALESGGNLASIVTLLTSISGFVDGLEGFVDGLETLTGALTETAPATDTASSGLNGRLQRVAQRLTTIVGHVDGIETLLAGGLPAALGSNGGLKVENLSVVPGTGATNLGKAEDSAHTSGDVGVMMLAKRADTPAATSDADGDYEPLQVRRGRLVVDVLDRLRVSVQSGGLTTASTAYTAGDQVGTLFTIANAARVSGGGGEIRFVKLIDAADIIGAYDVVIFRASVTLSGGDNGAFSISDSDALEIVDIVQLLGAFDIGGNRVAKSAALKTPYDCSGGTSLYAALITRGDHTFFAATTNLQLVVDLVRD